MEALYWKQVVPMREWALTGWGRRIMEVLGAPLRTLNLNCGLSTTKREQGPKDRWDQQFRFWEFSSSLALHTLARGVPRVLGTLFVLALLGQPKCPLGNWISKL